MENLVVSLVMQGKLTGKINEGKLIEMLERGSMKHENKQTIKVQRKRYALDSDDEDDDDDLL